MFIAEADSAAAAFEATATFADMLEFHVVPVLDIMEAVPINAGVRLDRLGQLTRPDPPSTAASGCRCREPGAWLSLSSGARLMASEAAAAVRAAIEMLPASQRRIVELAYFRGLTCREAAEVAGIPEGTAKSRLRLALAKLETMLDRQLLESS